MKGPEVEDGHAADLPIAEDLVADLKEGGDPDRDPGHHVPGTRTTGGGSVMGKTTEALKGPPKVYAPAGAQPSARSVVKTLLDEDTSPMDLPTLTEKLGIPFSKVDHFYQTQVDISDPLVKNFFEYELGTA